MLDHAVLQAEQLALFFDTLLRLLATGIMNDQTKTLLLAMLPINACLDVTLMGCCLTLACWFVYWRVLLLHALSQSCRMCCTCFLSFAMSPVTARAGHASKLMVQTC